MPRIEFPLHVQIRSHQHRGFRHVTATDCHQEPVGYDFFDDDREGYTSIYERYSDGTRWPCRMVEMHCDHAESCLNSWATKCLPEDNYDYREMKHPRPEPDLLTPKRYQPVVVRIQLVRGRNSIMTEYKQWDYDSSTYKEIDGEVAVRLLTQPDTVVEISAQVNHEKEVTRWEAFTNMRRADR